MRHRATPWLALFVCLSGFAVAQTLAKDPDILGVTGACSVEKQRSASTGNARHHPDGIKKVHLADDCRKRERSGRKQMTADKFYVMYRKSSEVGLTQHLAQFGGKSKPNWSGSTPDRQSNITTTACCRTRKSSCAVRAGRKQL